MKKKAWWKKAVLLCGDDGPFALLYGDLPDAHCIARTGSFPGTGGRSLPGLHGAGAGFKL